MMKHVGCYIRNDFYFKKNQPVKVEDEVESAIACATNCKKDQNCKEGWSFQQATGRCIYIGQDKNLNVDILQPGSHIQETNKTVGFLLCYNLDLI